MEDIVPYQQFDPAHTDFIYLDRYSILDKENTYDFQTYITLE
jgi:hypothetical protein